MLNFFETSGRNLLAAEVAAGVKHHVALSVVGSERLPDSGYFRAKIAQEKLIKASPVPYTIVRATQFYEFMGAIAQSSNEADGIHMPPATLQPIAASDVSAALADVAVAPPVNGTVEIAGPEAIGLDKLVRQLLEARRDERRVITDANALYFGAPLTDQTLTPAAGARLGPTRFTDWLTKSASQT